jgi:hypothetical protein
MHTVEHALNRQNGIATLLQWQRWEVDMVVEGSGTEGKGTCKIVSTQTLESVFE